MDFSKINISSLQKVYFIQIRRFLKLLIRISKILPKSLVPYIQELTDMDDELQRKKGQIVREPMIKAKNVQEPSI